MGCQAVLARALTRAESELRTKQQERRLKWELFKAMVAGKDCPEDVRWDDAVCKEVNSSLDHFMSQMKLVKAIVSDKKDSYQFLVISGQPEEELEEHLRKMVTASEDIVTTFRNFIDWLKQKVENVRRPEVEERRFIGCGEKSKKEEDSSAAREVEERRFIGGGKSKKEDSSAAHEVEERRFIGCGRKSKKEEDSSAAHEVEERRLIDCGEKSKKEEDLLVSRKKRIHRLKTEDDLPVSGAKRIHRLQRKLKKRRYSRKKVAPWKSKKEEDSPVPGEVEERRGFTGSRGSRRKKRIQRFQGKSKKEEDSPVLGEVEGRRGFVSEKIEE
ncbi:nucleolar protein 58-like [Tenebrio molitor]|uniref:nucleolar protein 58-like n=1 Tax=Tenebrio molitor TaxID=7067 RepID=UPI0036247334